MLEKLTPVLHALRGIRLVVVLVAALGGAAYSNKSSIPWLSSSSSKQSKQPLREVLPGRWTGEYKGQKYTLNFGRHSEVSVLIDVPFQYRARVGADQLWIGGNYHVENDQHLNCQWTDGRWAEMLAQMGGMPLNQVGIKSYTDEEMIDADDVHWKCIGHAAAGVSGEAVDIADQTPVINDAPKPKGASRPGQSVATKTLYDEQQKLSILYKQLEARRSKLNPKDKAAVAAFNKAAEDYSREVAALNSSNTTGARSMPPTPSPSASAR